MSSSEYGDRRASITAHGNKVDGSGRGDGHPVFARSNELGLNDLQEQISQSSDIPCIYYTKDSSTLSLGQESTMSLSQLPTTLLDLLSNSLVLCEIAPYLDIRSRFALEASSKTSRGFLRTSPTYRYLDLSTIISAQPPSDHAPVDTGGVNWRDKRMDEALTEDDFYGGPLRGIFSNLTSRQVLRDVRVLILDQLSVPSDLVFEILTEDRFNVHILSIRRVQHLNERKLCQTLHHVTRPSRPKGTPRIRGIYFFDPVAPIPTVPYVEQDSTGGVTSREGAQVGRTWSLFDQGAPSGRLFKTPTCLDWPAALKTCEGIIAFDAILCRGPRHSQAFGEGFRASFLLPSIASVAIDGCAKCGSSWEEPAKLGVSPQHHLPLVDPPPTHGFTVRDAQRSLRIDSNVTKQLFLRCTACLDGRRCDRCGLWWCERCYEPSLSGQRVDQASTTCFINLGLCSPCLATENMSHGGFGMWG